MSVVDIATPDLVIGPDGGETKEYDPLNPCEYCGAHRHEAPEGIHSVHSAHKNGAAPGDPVWNHPHCWRCGFRPGSNVAVSETQFRRMYDKLLAEVRANQPSLNPPNNSAEADALRVQLEQAKAESAELRSRLGADE